MARKKGSKAIWIGGSIHSAFSAKLKEEGWTWGLTKKVESLLSDYAQRGTTRSSQSPAGLDPEQQRAFEEMEKSHRELLAREAEELRRRKRTA